MPRESKPVIVPEFPGTRDRDKGKIFVLTEWPAARADDWFQKMVFAANRDGGMIPMNLKGIGLEGIAVLAANTWLRGNVRSEEIIPLWNELLQCVQIVRDPKRPDVVTTLNEDDVEEVATRQWLRLEVLSLHLNFSVADVLWTLWSSITAKFQEVSSTTQTSPPPSG